MSRRRPVGLVHYHELGLKRGNRPLFLRHLARNLRRATSDLGPLTLRQVSGRVLLDHLNEVTVAAARDAGVWIGFSIYPDTKMSPDRMVAILREYGPERVLVNSAADWGRSDPLLTVRTAEAMLAGGFDADDVDRVLWRNPVEFYAQSGRLDVSGVADVESVFAGNSILRGGS